MTRLQIARRAARELALLATASLLLGAAILAFHPKRPRLQFEPPAQVPEVTTADLLRLAGGEPAPQPGLVLVLPAPDSLPPPELAGFPTVTISPAAFDDGLSSLLDALDRAAPGALIAVAATSGPAENARALAKRLRADAGLDNVLLLQPARQKP